MEDMIGQIGGGMGGLVAVLYVVDKLFGSRRNGNGKSCTCNNRSSFDKLCKLGEDQLTELRTLNTATAVTREQHLQFSRELERLLAQGD